MRGQVRGRGKRSDVLVTSWQGEASALQEGHVYTSRVWTGETVIIRYGKQICYFNRADPGKTMISLILTLQEICYHAAACYSNLQIASISCRRQYGAARGWITFTYLRNDLIRLS